MEKKEGIGMYKKIEKMCSMMEGKRHIVFFGGAGVSTESGLKDFRGENGLSHTAKRYTPEEALSSRFFVQHTEEFFAYYRENMLAQARPNFAHFALAKLEREGRLDGVITQNIDGLHQMAGSRKVVELHGSVLRNYCTRCHTFYDVEKIKNEAVPLCGCGGVVKPDVVLYGESLKEEDIESAAEMIERADLLIVGGTSLSVYPAAGFVQEYRGEMILINKTPTPMDERAELLIPSPIGQVFRLLMGEDE